MREREDDVVMVTGQQPRPLEREPALGLEVGALRTRPMAARVVPDAGHMPLRTGLDMPPECGSAALHDGAGGAADMGGKRMGLLVGWIRVLKKSLERHERHRGLLPEAEADRVDVSFTVSREPSPRRAVSPTLSRYPNEFSKCLTHVRSNTGHISHTMISQAIA